MDYTVILNVVYTNGTTPKRSMYTAEGEAEALANFHKFLGQYIGAENVGFVLCMALDNYGNVMTHEVWKASAAE